MPVVSVWSLQLHSLCISCEPGSREVSEGDGEPWPPGLIFKISAEWGSVRSRFGTGWDRGNFLARGSQQAAFKPSSILLERAAATSSGLLAIIGQVSFESGVLEPSDER